MLCIDIWLFPILIMRMDAHMVHLKILFYFIWKDSLMYFVVDRG